MWTDQLQDARAQPAEEVEADGERAPGWYASAHAYWEDERNCPVSDNGVLGGFAHVSPADIQGSEAFFTRVSKLRPAWRREIAVDCGAGIGRVSKFLLLPHFAHVDLVEQSPRLLQSVPQYVGRYNSDVERVRSLFCMGLQDFEPAPESYDLIWVQWVSSHLTDADFVRFLQRCKQALRPHGWIGVKENTLLRGEPYELDREDSSITRYVRRVRRLAAVCRLLTLVLRAPHHQPGRPCTSSACSSRRGSRSSRRSASSTSRRSSTPSPCTRWRSALPVHLRACITATPSQPSTASKSVIWFHSVRAARIAAMASNTPRATRASPAAALNESFRTTRPVARRTRGSA